MDSAEQGGEHGGRTGRAVHSRLQLEVLPLPLGLCRYIRRGLAGHQHAAAVPTHSTETGSVAAARHRGSAEAAGRGPAVEGCNASEGSSAGDMLEDTRRVASVQRRAHDGRRAHGPIGRREDELGADSREQAQEGNSSRQQGDAHRAVVDSRTAAA